VADFQQTNLKKASWRLGLEAGKELPSKRVQRKHLKKGHNGGVYKAICE